MSTALTARFPEALGLAAGFHDGQVRKGRNTPYVAHLLGVAALVLEAGGGEDLAIAALLHDALEDADSDADADERRGMIRSRFGEEVLEVVEGCSDGDPDEKSMMEWRARKVRYIRHLQDRAGPEVLSVSLCDKLHNARAILRDFRVESHGVWERFTGKREGTLGYYHALFAAYRSREASLTLGFMAYVDDLGRALDELPEPKEFWKL